MSRFVTSLDKLFCNFYVLFFVAHIYISNENKKGNPEGLPFSQKNIANA